MNTIDLSIPPQFIIDMPGTLDGETIVGWRAITEHARCEEPCLAPDSSPHGHATIIGYQVVTDQGIYEFDLDGICYRASLLHRLAPAVTTNRLGTTYTDAQLRRIAQRIQPGDEWTFYNAGDLPPGWVAGWLGNIYVGISPEGDMHS